MAVTFTVTSVPGVAQPQVVGHMKQRLVDIGFAGTYTPGGDALPAGRFGFSKVYAFEPQGLARAAAGTTGDTAHYDYATGKLQLFEAGAAAGPGAEKGSGEAVITGQTLRAFVYGV